MDRRSERVGRQGRRPCWRGLWLYTNLSRRAYALGAIRLRRRILVRRRRRIAKSQVRNHLYEFDDPARPAEEREKAMVDRLLAATIDPQRGWATEVEICRPVVDRRLGWLLDPDRPGGRSGAGELMTARTPRAPKRGPGRSGPSRCRSRRRGEAALADPDSTPSAPSRR